MPKWCFDAILIVAGLKTSSEIGGDELDALGDEARGWFRHVGDLMCGRRTDDEPTKRECDSSLKAVGLGKYPFGGFPDFASTYTSRRLRWFPMMVSRSF